MTRLNSLATRMGPDLRDAIEAMPGLGGVALWVKFLDSDDPELIACTDGIHVEAGPGYEKYDEELEERHIRKMREEGLLRPVLIKPGESNPEAEKESSLNRKPSADWLDNLFDGSNLFTEDSLKGKPAVFARVRNSFSSDGYHFRCFDQSIQHICFHSSCLNF